MAQTDKWTKKERSALEQLGCCFVLDIPEVKTFDVIRHRNSEQPEGVFVHDLWLFEYQGERYLGKSEQVLESCRSLYAKDLRSFYHFALSLFYYGEETIPQNTFSFVDDPELPAVTFHISRVFERIETIKEIDDRIPISSISDPYVRKLFALYLMFKDNLFEYQGELYMEVFSRHGRDVVNEVLASALGRLAGILVPENCFGRYHPTDLKIKTAKGGKQTDLVERYVVSRMMCSDFPCPSLYDSLRQRLATDEKLEEELRPLIDGQWHNGNPFSIEKEDSGPRQRDLQGLIQEMCPHWSDLLLSDFWDHFLCGYRDRKLGEFFLPDGAAGPIVTVDYGEILSPELGLPVDEPHYQQKKKQMLQSFARYLAKIAQLPAGHPYKYYVQRPIARVLLLRSEFFVEMVEAIPELFLTYEWGQKRFCYERESLLDYFLSLVRLLSSWLELTYLPRRPVLVRQALMAKLGVNGLE